MSLDELQHGQNFRYMARCIVQCACKKWPYFHFWSKIWHYLHVLRPRFP